MTSEPVADQQETWRLDGMRLWLFENGKRTGVYLDVHYTGLEWAERARPIPARIANASRDLEEAVRFIRRSVLFTTEGRGHTLGCECHDPQCDERLALLARLQQPSTRRED